MKTSAIAVSGAVVALAMVYLVVGMFWPAYPSSPYDLADFAALPVADHGRIKPLDSLARTNLMILSGGAQTWLDAQDHRQPASRWLLDVMALALGDPPAERHALQDKVFRIDNDQVRSLLGLKAREGFRYSYAEILPRFDEFRARYQHVQGLPAAQRDLYDNKVMELANHLEVFHQLTPKLDAPQGSVNVPHFIPPRQPGEEWQTFSQALKTGRGQPHNLPLGLQEYLRMLEAYVKGESATFNDVLKDYRQALEKKYPQEMAAARFEVFFNHFQPFQKCYYLYGLVFLLSCLGWLLWRDLHWAAFWLAVLILLVHTWALGARIYLSGRPPVTNLYSSAVFIGWGAIIVCLILEAIFRLGIGNVVGGLIGVLTLIIAHYLSLDGDTMKVLMAVLDTNFWLAAHVLVIVLGYTAMFVAGFIGIAFAWLGPITLALNGWGKTTNLLQPAIRQDVYRMAYGVTCFGMVTSFVGTVLGGIWADQSWGRFWGWDPKENGALLIVIWCAIMLHARWGGLVKARGFAALAILGNVVTAWSYFGTNQLDIGLHSYGFKSGTLTWLLIFGGSQLVMTGICLVPDRFWLRYAPDQKPEAVPIKETTKPPAAMATASRR